MRSTGAGAGLLITRLNDATNKLSHRLWLVFLKSSMCPSQMCAFGRRSCLRLVDQACQLSLLTLGNTNLSMNVQLIFDLFFLSLKLKPSARLRSAFQVYKVFVSFFSNAKSSNWGSNWSWTDTELISALSDANREGLLLQERTQLLLWSS